MLGLLVSAGCIQPSQPPGNVTYESDANLMLRMTDEPERYIGEGIQMIPESPVTLKANAEVLNSSISEIQVGDRVAFELSYYSSPMPPGFEDRFLSKFGKDAVIGISACMVGEKIIRVNIGNSPDWENQVYIIEPK